jgi:hypothetical protein
MTSLFLIFIFIMTKTITAFGITTAVLMAGAFLYNTPTNAEASAPVVVTSGSSCGGAGQPSCGCTSAGECGQSTCTTKKSSCGCGK